MYCLCLLVLVECRNIGIGHAKQILLRKYMRDWALRLQLLSMEQIETHSMPFPLWEIKALLESLRPFTCVFPFENKLT